ncbi:MAG: hypothetical protein K8F30_05740 [Taibaiella sp.]|nr:hypothetical protein [Taibaiella sp.]
MRSIGMKNILKALFKLYTFIPYLFFAAFLLVVAVSGLVAGEVVINDKLFDSILLKPLIMVCLAGIFIFPLVALSVILYNRRVWSRLVYPLLSYSLYIVSVATAGYIGWWTD